MTDDELKRAFQKRQRLFDPIENNIKAVDAVIKMATPDTQEKVLGFAHYMTGAAAVYFLQMDVSKDEFLAHAAEAYDLYTHVVNAAKKDAETLKEARDGAEMVARGLRNEGQVS